MKQMRHKRPNPHSRFSWARVLGAYGFDVHTATPQQWKFGVGLNAVLGQDLKARKNASRAKAVELFPQHADLFARVKDDSRAEAALMAWWFVHKKSAAWPRRGLRDERNSSFKCGRPG